MFDYWLCFDQMCSFFSFLDKLYICFFVCKYASHQIQKPQLIKWFD